MIAIMGRVLPKPDKPCPHCDAPAVDGKSHRIEPEVCAIVCVDERTRGEPAVVVTCASCGLQTFFSAAHLGLVSMPAN
jgi:RNase P subunit RPR2